MTEPREMQQQLDDQRRKVDVDNYTITVRELIAMAERYELHRAPDYQRKFRWTAEDESRLIESVLLGLPVPNIFVATNVDGSWDVVDGLQRVSTLIHFISQSNEQLREVDRAKPLRLSGLRTLTSFNDKLYAELPMPVQLNFAKRGIGVTALSDKSDPNTRFDTFERLNRGALKLSPQEIRACVYLGNFNSLLRRLAGNSDFTRLVKLQKENEANATREELVLKFFAYLNGREAFRGSVDGFLTKYMEDNRDTFDIEAGSAEFSLVIDELLRVGPVPFLRKNTSITPQNQLEAVMVACAEALRENKKIKPRAGWQNDAVLIQASTGATNTKTKLKQRIDRAYALLTGV